MWAGSWPASRTGCVLSEAALAKRWWRKRPLTGCWRDWICSWRRDAGGGSGWILPPWPLWVRRGFCGAAPPSINFELKESDEIKDYFVILPDCVHMGTSHGVPCLAMPTNYFMLLFRMITLIYLNQPTGICLNFNTPSIYFWGVGSRRAWLMMFWPYFWVGRACDRIVSSGYHWGRPHAGPGSGSGCRSPGILPPTYIWPASPRLCLSAAATTRKLDWRTTTSPQLAPRNRCGRPPSEGLLHFRWRSSGRRPNTPTPIFPCFDDAFPAITQPRWSWVVSRALYSDIAPAHSGSSVPSQRCAC